MTRIGQFPIVVLAAALLALVGILALPAPPAVVYAGPEDNLIDSDGDFLPDVVEWAVLTDANNPDTDNDGAPDFVEVVQRGSPRHPGVTVASDHEVRIVMTGPSPGNTTEPTYLHLFFRFFGSTSLMTQFSTWIELDLYPGLQLPLNVLGANTIMRDRQTTNDGYWLQVSVPMISEAVLRQFLPCTIRTQATIGTAVRDNSVRLVDVAGSTCSLVPFGDGRYVLQTIGVLPVTMPVSNKVCAMEFEQVGTGPGGVTLQCVAADCESANDLECGLQSCQQSVGWSTTISGGLGSL